MNETQRKILVLATTRNLAEMTLKEIADAVGVGTPQLVQHHLNQLVKKGFLWIDRRAGDMKLLTSSNSDQLVKIPVMGTANCGVATQFAEDKAEGYLPIAPGLLGLKSNKKYFAVRAIGDSMNRAKIRTIGEQRVGVDDGDLVIAESRNTPSSQNPYIVAVIDGLANIKKLVRGDGYARLESESSNKYMPIYLEPNLGEIIAGEVVAVVKG